jgi:hypothetical protein
MLAFPNHLEAGIGATSVLRRVAEGETFRGGRWTFGHGNRIMAFWIAVLAVTALLTASPWCSFALDTPTPSDGAPDALAAPESTLTREQWQQRVDAARRRSEDFVANARTQTPIAPPSDPPETEASDRVVNDPTLRHGDIVSTGRGFFVFTGQDEEHQSSDFVPIPKPNPPR